MLILTFSDLHINEYKQYSKNNGQDRLENCLKFLTLAFKFARKNDIEYILFPGDLYDSHDVLRTNVVNHTVARFTQLFEEFSNIKFIAVSGNHDQGSKNTLHKPAVTALDHLNILFPNNFYLIDNRSFIISNDAFTSPDIPYKAIIYGIPYYEYAKDFKAALEKLVMSGLSPKGKKDTTCKHILMMHQTPKGLDNDCIPVDVDPNDPLFEYFDIILNGHIHKHQVITDKFIDVGTPLHRDLGDEGQEKGFLVLHTEDLPNFQFVSTKGKFPEYIRKLVDDITEEDKQSNFIVPQLPFQMPTAKEKENTEQFRTNLSPDQLLTNFWEKVDGKDKELLSVGLGFLELEKAVN